MNRLKEHILRSTIAFIIVMLFTMSYAGGDGNNKALVDLVLESGAFKFIVKAALLALVFYLAFGKLRSKA